MSTRIYVVTDIESNRHRLVRAANQAQAMRHVAQACFDVEVASQDDLVKLLSSGHPIELAGVGATVDMFEETISNAGGTD